ncbi:multi-sensor hybrid histidine kinase [Treponema primitia ZAS-2]|uniref:histidine kinase n=1 Tax=Treponema primitia (strain ATCC BAA-887 / DSM 12427 / ZAS-2) TaxID=545694 RepID=F5YME0_TREPZ|nr:ATP-binding protein [Treponema primitia]AEF87032.1 multi-sensor hybrid histidine kinase [Treponema primitia ZAS-2]
MYYYLLASAFACIVILSAFLVRFKWVSHKRMKQVSRFSTRASQGYLDERIEALGDSDFRKIAESLNVLMENMANMSRAKGDFLSRMSHEIRTPMNAIIGMTLIAKSCFQDEQLPDDAAGDRVLDCLQKIEDNSNHLLGIVNDILDFSKIEAGKLTLDESLISLTQNMDFILSMFKSRMTDKEISFNAELQNIKNEGIITDALRLNQVLINLLSNALKFTPQGGRIDLVVEELLHMGNEGVYRFTVSDSGIGIESEQAKKLFTPFVQANAGINTNFGGTGLGLVISKNIVEMMGGEIELQSEGGKGSVFSFTIRVKSQESGKQPKNEDDSADNPDFRGKRFLIVDDIDINREICIELMGVTGAEMETAENGQEAVDMFMKSPEGYYDLILMDMQMPVLDGCEATIKIRQSKRSDALTISIIAMTANVMKEDIQKVHDAGMNGHIGKPVDIDKAFHTMQKIMGDSNGHSGKKKKN